MICKQCGTTVADSAKFCPRCGARLIPAQPTTTQQTVQQPPRPISVQQQPIQVPPQQPVYQQPVYQQPPVQQAVPQQQKKKRDKKKKKKNPLVIIIVILLIVALLVSGGFVLFKQLKEKKAAEDLEQYEPLYASVLQRYKLAIDESWTEDKFFEGHLCPLLSPAREKTAELGFTFVDINRDKQPELFIGRVSEPGVVYDLYTIQDGTIVQLATATEKESIVYTDDGRLIQTNTANTERPVTKVLALESNSLTATDTYVHDTNKTLNGKDEWFHADSDLPVDALDIHSSELTPISEEAYHEAVEEFEPADLKMKTFSELEVPETDETPDDTAEAVEWLAPAMSVTEAVQTYLNNATVWFDSSKDTSESNPSSNTNFYFFDLDGDGTMELRKTRTRFDSDDSVTTFFRIDPISKQITKIPSAPSSGQAEANFDRFHLLLKDKTTGAVRILCEDFIEYSVNEYERIFGTLEYTSEGLASNLLFSVRYQVQDSEDWNLKLIGNPTYSYYESGTETVTSEADYRARFDAFLQNYDRFYLGESGFGFYNTVPETSYILERYQAATTEKITSAALTQAAEIPASDQGTLLTADASDKDLLKTFLTEYLCGGVDVNDPVMHDVITYDYRDADATEKAYLHMAFGIFGNCNFPHGIFGYGIDVNESPYVEWGPVPASKVLTKTNRPGSAQDAYLMEYDPYYMKADADYFDAALQAAYNVTPDRNFVRSPYYADTSYQIKSLFYDGGFCYIWSQEAGDAFFSRFTVTEMKQRDDGAYDIKIHYSEGYDDESYVYHERAVTDLEATVALKEVYGERIWSLYQIKEVY